VLAGMLPQYPNFPRSARVPGLISTPSDPLTGVPSVSVSPESPGLVLRGGEGNSDTDSEDVNMHMKFTENTAESKQRRK